MGGPVVRVIVLCTSHGSKVDGSCITGVDAVHFNMGQGIYSSIGRTLQVKDVHHVQDVHHVLGSEVKVTKLTR